VTRVAIDCFPAKDSMLPSDIGRGKLTWGDLRKQRDLFTLQFSAASSLSKDPEEKRGEIQFLIDSGLIDKGDVSRFYQLPDLEGAYTLAGSAQEYVERIISNAIKDGDIDYAETIDLQLLKSKALAKLNQLNAADDDAVYIDRLTELLYKVMADIKNVSTLMAPEQAPPPPVQPSVMALDAGQITALSALATAVDQGMPPASARAIAALSFPSADPQALDAVIQGALPQPPAQPMAQAPAPGIPVQNGGMQ
jgi:hypothetical protein